MLVIGEDIELAVALRDRLDRAYVTVCDARTGEAETALRSCRPRPWMVVGDTAELPGAALRMLAQHPIVLFWRGAAPPRLPAHNRGVELFSELVAAAEQAIGADVGGIRLAPGTGLCMPGGGHAANAALEVLVALHPRPLFAPARHVRAVAATLESHSVPFRLTGTPGDGWVLDRMAA